MISILLVEHSQKQKQKLTALHREQPFGILRMEWKLWIRNKICWKKAESTYVMKKVKDGNILGCDNVEYWKISRCKSTEKIVGPKCEKIQDTKLHP